MFKQKRWLLSAMLACSTQTALAETCRADSGLNINPLLELYTSEGCSSCPPADQWLSQLKQTMHNVNALAFHVDYWDGLGWKDAYAQTQFSEKQRQQARRTGNAVVYTPQFTLNGQDFRAWGDARLTRASQALAKTPSQVQIQVLQTAATAQQFALLTNIQPLKKGPPAQLYLAVYEHGLSSQVKAGENSGRTLHHDFVVRQWLGPFVWQTDQPWQHRQLLDMHWLKQPAGVVAYVQATQSGEILQSVRLPFCASD